MAKRKSRKQLAKEKAEWLAKPETKAAQKAWAIERQKELEELKIVRRAKQLI